jgi:hypothetical protein
LLRTGRHCRRPDEKQKGGEQQSDWKRWNQRRWAAEVDRSWSHSSLILSPL